MGTLITGARIADPLGRLPAQADVLIEGGRIAAVGKKLPRGKHRVVRKDGLHILPGLVDIHAHLREPGFEYKETLETGLRAAALGGFTSVVCMPNTSPAIDNKSVVKYLKDRSRAVGAARLYVAGAVSKGRRGEELADIGEMFEEGIVAITDDGAPVMNSRLMRRAMEYSKIFGIPVMSHCEDLNLTAGGLMNEGVVSTRLGLAGIPAAGEEIMTARDVSLAALTGARLHVTHVSTRGAAETVRNARRKRLRVTCDVTPHHLLLTDEDVRAYDTATKVNPPLRTAGDREALAGRLADGTIAAIATDHAPHAAHEKETSFEEAPFGAVGFESAVPALLTELVHRRKLPLALIARKMALEPARVMNLPGGKIAPGEPADLTILDLNAGFTIQPGNFVSLGRNCPFAGMKVKGRVDTVIVGGGTVVEDGRLVR
ncbi:MAG: dihydroorotase [bacterium]